MDLDLKVKKTRRKMLFLPSSDNQPVSDLETTASDHLLASDLQSASDLDDQPDYVPALKMPPCFFSDEIISHYQDLSKLCPSSPLLTRLLLPTWGSWKINWHNRQLLEQINDLRTVLEGILNRYNNFCSGYLWLVEGGVLWKELGVGTNPKVYMFKKLGADSTNLQNWQI